ncbi:type II secretion system major pseudopilin GspG [Aquirhabdus sp.]|uniref:type II secretion system major pseudopilin GspG n=1 Tax=Aquirhabdus sp. TaxID=2824160 RepID=UPI00396CDB71
MNIQRNVTGIKRKSQSGFTLIEVMVVIVILGILGGLVVPKLFGQLSSSKVKVTKITLSNTAGALKSFYLDNNRFPTTQEGLDALVHKPANVKVWREPYIEGGKVPQDAWDNDLQYLAPGNDGNPYDLYSFGADGKDGGEGDDADLHYQH